MFQHAPFIFFLVIFSRLNTQCCSSTIYIYEVNDALLVMFFLIFYFNQELAEPSIRDAFGLCVQQGANRVIVSPFFLFPGRHWHRVIHCCFLPRLDYPFIYSSYSFTCHTNKHSTIFLFERIFLH